MTNETTVRIAPALGHVFVPPESETGTERRRLDAPELTVLNAANRSVNVSVALEPAEDTAAGDTAFRTTHDLEPRSGVTDRHLVSTAGPYDLVVTVGSATVRTSWRLGEDDGSRTVVVWPDGSVSVEPRPTLGE